MLHPVISTMSFYVNSSLQTEVTGSPMKGSGNLQYKETHIGTPADDTDSPTPPLPPRNMRARGQQADQQQGKKGAASPKVDSLHESRMVIVAKTMII